MSPIQQRARSHVAKVSERRRTGARPETIPEEDVEAWDFSSSDTGEEEEEGEADALASDWQTNSTLCGDKRGRFVVEQSAASTANGNGSQLGSPITMNEEHQSSIQSASPDEKADVPAEIRKGRFSVNSTGMAVMADGVTSPTSTVQFPSGLGQQLPIGCEEEEGRKSRFEVVLPSPQELAARPRLASHPVGQHCSVATLPTEETSPSMSAGNGSINGVHRPNPHHARANNALQQERLVEPFPAHVTHGGYWPPQQQQIGIIDHLLHQTELMRHQLLELRARWPYYAASSSVSMPPQYHVAHMHQTSTMHAPPPPPPPSFDYYVSPQYSPVQSVHASQAELMQCRSHSEQPAVSDRDLERQLAQLKLENDQLRRRFQ